MRILQLCHKPPLPAVDGGCLAMNAITRGLLDNGCEVKVLAMSTHKHPFLPGSMAADHLERTGMEAVFVNTKITRRDAFANLFSKESYNISRFVSEKFRSKLQSVLRDNEFEIVLLESLFVTPYIETIRKNCSAKLVLRSHNIEYLIWERMAKQERNSVKRSYLYLLSKRLKKYELQLMNEYDAVVSISSADGAFMQNKMCTKPLCNIPYGIDIQNYKYNNCSEINSDIFFIGALDWLPNIEGLQWFFDRVWPKLRSQYPLLEFHIAGRGIPAKEMKYDQENIVMHGEVADAKMFMAKHGVMVVPLLSGRGIRIKILEAMALSKPVVSTSVGISGITHSNDEDVAISDAPQGFIAKVGTLITNQQLRLQMGNNARKRVENEYDNRRIGKQLVQFIETL